MAKPNRIVLIRHGNSAANADSRVRADTPDHRIPLTAAGHEQARQAGAAMLDLFGEQEIAVYLSPYVRTRETFAGLKLGEGERLKVVKEYEDPRIREQDFTA